MKNLFNLLLLFLLTTGLSAQVGHTAPDGTVPNEHNIVGAEYPRVGEDGRTYFRVYAPDAQKVEVSFRGEMKKEEDGFWTLTSEGPEVVGFHYYQIIIDGVSVADPNGKPFFGMGKWVSGIEIPEKDGAYYKPKEDVAKGSVREEWYYSAIRDEWRRSLVYTPAEYDRNPGKNILFFICNTAWERMKRAGPTKAG